MVMVVDGRAGCSVSQGGCGRSPCTRCCCGSKRARRGGRWSFSGRSRSKLQQTSGKALPLGRERQREIERRERKISDDTHPKKTFGFVLSFVEGSDLLYSAKLCSCGNKEYVKMSEMQGCQLKQIKLSPALHSKHTWCAHTLITPRHTQTYTHTQMHKAAIHNFPPLLVNAGKSDQILYHLQSGTAKPGQCKLCLEVKERKRVKAEGKSRQGMREKRLVISLLTKRCESGDQ